jgi:putative ABC transport system permease protein
MSLFPHSLQSLWNRKTTTVLTLLSIAISVTLLLSIERIRLAARESFENTISRTDLVVGARTSPLQLILYSVFRIGDPTNNVSWESYQHFAHHKETAWTIPISLGDSHKGFRVVGTDHNYFANYHYSGGHSLEFSQGKEFQSLFDAVIGADVAEKLHYHLDQKIIIAHGAGARSFQEHSNLPFTIVGILKKTGTPVDQSVHVTLEAIEAIHVGWENGAPPEQGPKQEDLLKKHFPIHQITAFFMGLKSRMGVLQVQREINNYTEEPLTAALPGVVLMDLWRSMTFMENILKLLSLLVFATSILSLFLVLLTSLKERRREMAILRSVGAKPGFIFSLFTFESSLITLAGILLGVVLTFGSLFLVQPILNSRFGLSLDLLRWSTNDLYYLCVLFGISLVVGFIPAILAYKQSLADGLTIKY